MRAQMRGESRVILLGVIVLGSIAGLVSLASIQGGESASTEGGSVQGKILLEIPGTTLATVGPIVVFLEPEDSSLKPAVPEKPVIMEQKDVKFVPDFAIVCIGQPLEMPNLDKISHNAFSFSKPNTFDLGVYPKGETRKVTFQHSGLVDLFCSIHSKMNATVYVAPTPYHARVSPAGAFEIRDIPSGKYTLKTWNRKLPEAKQSIEISQGKGADVAVKIAAGK